MNTGDRCGIYTLEKLLGRGSNSQVFLAVAPDGFRVALKVHLLERGAKTVDRPAWAERVRREADATRHFQHPNVVVIHDVGIEAGEPYVAMDYILGEPLAAFSSTPATLADPAVRMPAEVKARWVLETGAVLASIHEAGLVHRNVRPSNFIVRRDGALRVLDFGVARRSVDRAAGMPKPKDPRAPSTPTPSPTVESPAYLAPEVLGHAGGHQPSDQFGWAVMAYELLTGMLPWGHERRGVQVLHAILTADPPPPSSMSSRLPRLVDTVLLRALEKSPAKRYATMREAVSALAVAMR